MINTITFNQLLAYAYNETGLLESDRIQRTIDGDPLIQFEYQELVGMLTVLDGAVPKVSEKCIETLMEKIEKVA